MFLKELTELNGVSGNEEDVREFIKKEAKKYSDEINVDSMGNLICLKKGRNSKYKVMISAHMDEVGFMVTGYGEAGVLKFATVGGIDNRILLGKRLTVGNKKLQGVIGGKPIHLQNAGERQSNVNIKKMYIDIGANSKEEAEKLVSVGEYAAFYSSYSTLGKNAIKAKALDDRAGCAILLDILKDEQYDFDLYACFTVQEEVGLRGAQVTSYGIYPDVALVVEATTCSDVLDVEEHEYSTILGEGAALTIMDRGAYSNKKLVEFLYTNGKKNSISVQYKTTTSGGNDAGKIQTARGGVIVASISVPCRYIHSPVSLMSKNDFDSCSKLVKIALGEFNKNPKLIDGLK
ncbi:M42 family metallopeptidase [Herbivorax sp. ANBcel31]|uniref:M42 family metallopeptidase n=1 Tax=Herbivorax sp. ANBcel31 TaxID=3069754 RepID=UPI0027B4DA2B|nr:M42 family metallopeptidase [Herbivorax sp. ANBcel31]MDQ2086785.1 M42 family metallopeptidase [Herbivorax sp. ANBcel31]